jgi:signal transduction histidine kinase
MARDQTANADIVTIPPALERAYAEDPDVDAVAGSAVDAVRAVLAAVAARGIERASSGPVAHSVRFVVNDASGRLRVAVADGEPRPSVPGRERRRRSAVLERRAIRAPVLRPRGHCLAVLPLISSERTFGVLEVVGPGSEIDAAWSALEAVAGQAAVSLRHLAGRRRLERQEGALRVLSGLTRELVRARTTDDVLRWTIEEWHDGVGQPAAAWIFDDDGRLALDDVRGVDAAQRSELVRRVAGSAPTLGRKELASRAAAAFADVVGTDDVEAIDAGRGVITLGGVAEATRESVRLIGSVVPEAIARLESVAWAERRERELDRSLAVTAHELREPVLAAKAQIDSMLYLQEWGVGHRQALRRSRGELEALVELAEGMLRWTANGDSPRLRRIELVGLVRQIASSIAAADRSRRVTVRAPDRVFVKAARLHLRVAIANVIRNAVAFSPPGGGVGVCIEANADVASILVQDEGPGVDPSDARAIFDPFARGSSTYLPRSGRGLGLYIARRVIEAHRGTIALEPGDRPRGAVFRITLPAYPPEDADRRADAAPDELSMERDSSEPR